MEYLPKVSVNKIYSFVKKSYNNSSTTKKNKNCIVLEPLSVMIKLSLLYFKSEGTKLSIKDNTIMFQEPDIVQGINRYLNNDKSIDITKLYIPIIKSLSRYKNNSDFIFLFNISIDGLEKLKKNYTNPNCNSTITTINSYIALMKSYINGVNMDVDNVYTNNNSDGDIWKEEDIKLIVNYFRLLLEESNSDNLKQKYIRVICNIAELKENIAKEMINRAVELF